MKLPPDRVTLIDKGGFKGLVWEVFFKLFGIIPFEIKHWIEQINPQLIHAHFGPDGAYIMPLAKKLGLPLIVSFLGTDVTLDENVAKKKYISFKFYYFRRSRLIDYVDAVVVPSDFVKQLVLRHGFPESKIRLIHHGIDLSRFSAGQTTPVWGNILFVGRLIPLKGLDYLINAIQLLRKKGLKVHLTVIGDGESRDYYEVMARKKITAGYDFLGSQPQDRVIKAMSKAYVFCMPSITMPDSTAETFGMVFAEAQAMGVPVVSFNSGGISEVVENGITGLLVPEKDTLALAEAIRQLLEDQNLRNRMGKSARERVELLFDFEKQNALLEDLYDNILKPNEEKR